MLPYKVKKNQLASPKTWFQEKIPKHRFLDQKITGEFCLGKDIKFQCEEEAVYDRLPGLCTRF